MHPKAVLDVCAQLVGLTLKFDAPTDAIVARFFREHRGLGPRERASTRSLTRLRICKSRA